MYFNFSVPPSTVNLKITPSRPRAGEMVIILGHFYYVQNHVAFNFANRRFISNTLISVLIAFFMAVYHIS